MQLSITPNAHGRIQCIQSRHQTPCNAQIFPLRTIWNIFILKRSTKTKSTNKRTYSQNPMKTAQPKAVGQISADPYTLSRAYNTFYNKDTQFLRKLKKLANCLMWNKFLFSSSFCQAFLQNSHSYSFHMLCIHNKVQSIVFLCPDISISSVNFVIK